MSNDKPDVPRLSNPTAETAWNLDDAREIASAVRRHGCNCATCRYLTLTPDNKRVDYPIQSNELHTYNLADTRAWLEEVIGQDGIGEHATNEQKAAAETILSIMTGMT